MKPQEVRVLNSDGVFSWQQFWSYFKSDRCTDEMRLWTLQNVNILDCISGVTSAVQVEILQHAPPELLNHPRVQIMLTQDAKQSLMTTQVGWTQKDQDEFVREYTKYLKQKNKRR